MLADNLVHFSRLLRATGMAVGPDRVLAAIAAVEAVGLERREDVRAALAAVMLERHEQQAIFDAAFDAFFRDPGRAVGALASAEPARPAGASRPSASVEIRLQTERGASDRERLAQADFERMTGDEYELAKKLAERAPLPVRPLQRRRHEASLRGTLDLRRTLQGMARSPHTLAPAFTEPRTERPPLVVLLDISGSMERYSRVFLHYVHGLTRRHLKVHTFVFGTRLTDITRCLRHRDPDMALKMADERVQDWKGGTRIASSLAEFNHRWARRVLGGNAAVLLVTDGLERDEAGALSRSAAQLQRMAHEVVWLNPLLRFDGFQPRAEGIRALLAHVDRFLPVHNLASLADLAQALQRPALNPSHLLH